MIFFETAPKYWEKGLPAIPLRVKEKRPYIDKWSQYCRRMPTVEEQMEWLHKYPQGNIGLALGPCAGLVVVDVDTEDEAVNRALNELLPPTPWVRIGKKGSARAYRYTGNLKTFRVKESSGRMLIEVLGDGTQIVLPPSVHPETGRAYWSEEELYDVIDRVPFVSNDIEDRIRNRLVELGKNISTSGWSKILEFVPQGARDSKMVAHAGLLARAVLRGERTLVEALAELEHWIDTYCENVVGDPVDKNKARTRLAQFIIRDLKTKKDKALPRGWDRGLEDESIKNLILSSIVKEDIQWSGQQIREYFKQEMQNNPPGSKGRMLAMELALDKIIEARMSEVEEAATIDYMAKESDGELKPSIAIRALRNRRQGSVSGDSHSEVAMAVLDDLSEYGELRHYAGNFWQWKGAQWEVLDESIILKHISEQYGGLPAAKRYSDHMGILKTMAAKISGKLKVLETPGVNFANGYLTIDGRLLPHNSGFGCTYVLPYRYIKEEAGKASKWMNFLYSIWGEDDDYEQKVTALGEAIAVTMLGIAPRYSRAFCLYGVARSGKTQLLNIISNLMPPEGRCSVHPSEWGDKFAPAMMVGKSLNVCGELSENKLIDGSRFKEIVEGSEIVGQYKGKPLFHFTPTCAHWFAGNFLPRSRDGSEGFFRRWLFFEFKKKVSDKERILDIGNVIVAEEREAIVAWALEKVIDLEKRREFTLPRSHFFLVNKVAKLTNSLRLYLERCDNLEFGEDFTTDSYALYSNYVMYLMSNSRARPMDREEWIENLRQMGVEVGIHVDEDEIVHGVRLKS